MNVNINDITESDWVAILNGIATRNVTVRLSDIHVEDPNVEGRYAVWAGIEIEEDGETDAILITQIDYAAFCREGVVS
jgi:UDP-N-acetyl-D-mannosaminuronate dehydrogenase